MDLSLLLLPLCIGAASETNYVDEALQQEAGTRSPDTQPETHGLQEATKYLFWPYGGYHIVTFSSNPKAQNGPNALHNVVFESKSLRT